MFYHIGNHTMALDNNKPLGEQIDWADIAQKLLTAFHAANDRRTSNSVSSEAKSQATIAMSDLAQALDTIVSRQEKELSRGTRIANK
jgi:hypothetical protein